MPESFECPCGRTLEEQIVWYALKVDRQRRRLKRLEDVQRASKLHNLAAMYISARATAQQFAQTVAWREKAYMKGYQQGFMDRHQGAGLADVLEAGLAKGGGDA